MAPDAVSSPGGDVSAPSSAPPSSAGSPSTPPASPTSSAPPAAPAPEPKWEEHPRTRGLLAETQKERQARHAAERKHAEYDAQLAEANRKIAALTNTKIPTAEEADESAVRERFAALYPHLAGLTQEDIDGIKAWQQEQPQRQRQEEYRWTVHSRGMLDAVHTKLSAELGDLTERQKQNINALYVRRAETDPAFLQRHDAGDERVIAEFVKDYLEDTAEPVRRKQVASDLGRARAVPNGGNRSVPSHDGKPIDVTNDKAVMDLLIESRKGQFGRR